MNGAPPYVTEAALTAGLPAHIVDRLLARHLPALLAAMSPEQRAEVIAYRDAVKRAADAYQRCPRTDVADVPEADVEAVSPVEIGAGQAAEILGVSRRHARRLAASGMGRKVGTTWLLDRRLVDFYRDRRTA